MSTMKKMVERFLREGDSPEAVFRKARQFSRTASSRRRDVEKEGRRASQAVARRKRAKRQRRHRKEGR